AQDDKRLIEHRLRQRPADMTGNIDSGFLQRDDRVFRNPFALAGGDPRRGNSQGTKGLGVGGERMLQQTCGHGTATNVGRADDKNSGGRWHQGRPKGYGFERNAKEDCGVRRYNFRSASNARCRCTARSSVWSIKGGGLAFGVGVSGESTVSESPE